jgi:serine/threonine-protein kinase
LPEAVTRLADALLVAPERAGPAGLPFVAGYELRGLLGRGGMGLVYQARHVPSGRTVALKMLLGGAHAELAELARFRAEAEAVTRLRHPNIVQLFEVGSQDGWAYFALEYLPGGSLARHLAGTPQPAGASARLVQTLAHAMQFAHEHGIVHRDLKPGNILLASGGREPPEGGVSGGSRPPLAGCVPKITDFGLAKRLDVEPAAIASDGRTRTGQLLGTPSYMAPEQTWGRPADVGPAADVYALGAILYECLTGRPPFRAPTPVDTLLQIRSTEPVPPRRLVPSVPRDLETICLTCLQKDPRRRYASARALAEDLGRFLTGAPVEARRAGPRERVVRWARRRPAWAALTGVCTAALVSLVALGVWHYAALHGYNAELRAERANADRLRELAQTREAEAVRQQGEAQKQWRRAEVNFRKALAAVEQLLLRVSVEGKRLAHEPRMELLRRALLRDALRFYQAFLNERGEDPGVRLETATAYFRVADIQKELGQAGAAEEAYGAAAKLLQGLVDEFPREPRYRYDLAGVHNNLGGLLMDRQRPDEAERAIRRALEIQTVLVQEFPDSTEYRIALAGSRHNLGTWLVGNGRLQEGEEALRAALDVRRRLAEANPDKPECRQDVARTVANLATAVLRAGRLHEAGEGFREARDMQELLVKGFPKVPAYRLELAGSHQGLAVVLAQTGQAEEAEAAYRSAADLLRRLAEDFPRVPTYRDVLARNQHKLGAFFARRQQPQDAEQAYRQALDLRQGLVNEFPRVAAYRRALASTWGQLAAVLRDQGRWDAARQAAEEARKHQQGEPEQ